MPKTITFTKKFLINDWNDPNKTALTEYVTSLKVRDKLLGYSNIYTDTVNIPTIVASATVISTLNTLSIPNPLQGFLKDDACILQLKEPQYYIRFGALLNYIKNNIIIKIKNSKDKELIFNIDTNLKTQKMYSLPNRISLDPRVCIVRNSKIDIGSFKSNPSGSISETDDLGFVISNNDNTKAIAFDSLQPFTDEDNDGTNKNSAYILNIYLNFNFVLESLAADSKGNVSVYDLLSKICTGLNRALGGINNLEPIIDETSNILRIIDTTPIPKTPNEPDYSLQIYGYNKLGNNYISNFVRKFDLKTAITPEFATMITVGATAGGYVKGVEATAFSKWNTGLTDRFKKEMLPPKGEISSLDDDEATENYEDAFRDHYRRYGIISPSRKVLLENKSIEAEYLTTFISNAKFSNNLIEKNISVMTEYYKYLIATSTRNKDTSGGTVGFIPFKLTITMDGLSGIKIYNVLHINTEFLPIAYGRTVDLIVTGVSHNLSNNDWETSIETTAMPKTSSPFGKVSKSTSTRPTQTNSTIITGVNSCSVIPKGNGITEKERTELKRKNIDYLTYKNISNNDKSIINFIRSKNEGGYFHPIHIYKYNSKSDIVIKTGFGGMGVSGETLWGEDRFAGDGDSTPNKIKFWSIVDKYSGFGDFSKANLTKGKKDKYWKDYKFQPYQEKGWKYNNLKDISNPPSWSGRIINQTQWNIDLKTLEELKFKIVSDSFYALLNSKNGFKNYPELKNLILSDARTRYMWYRARYNGANFFKNYAENLKKIWNEGIRDINQIICKDFTYRYNYNKGQTYEPDIKRMADLIIPNR